jgi:hypothetical protein
MKKMVTDTRAIVAPVAEPEWWLTSRPVTTARNPIATAVSITMGTLLTMRIAVAGGATRNANTRRLPTASNAATIDTARRPMSTRLASRGRSPSRGGLGLVEGEHQERPVECDRTCKGDQNG